MIETERLILRPWRDADRDPFAALSADPEVMEHFERPLTRAESDRFVDWLVEHQQRFGFTEWAVERRGDGAFLGMVGLSHIHRDDHPLAPGVEIGWRLARHAWSGGYASEAARAALAHGFGRLGLDEIVSFTAVPNLRSQAVMARIGLTRAPDRDFDHPALPEGHRLRPHVVWVTQREAWPPG